MGETVYAGKECTCRMLEEEHVDGKCLYEPTTFTFARWRPIQVSRSLSDIFKEVYTSSAVPSGQAFILPKRFWK